jgi:methyl-accepting chemotaxis protein
MNRQTKHNKRNRIKNKTKKYYGGKTNQGFQESRGIFDIVGDKLESFSGKTVSYVADKGLRLLGLQPINNNQESETNDTAKVDEKIGEISDAASGLVSNAKGIGADVLNVFDKGSAAVIGQINDVLESPKIENSITEAAGETAEIGTKLLDKFNERLSTPEFKEAAKVAIDNAADYTNIVVEAMDEPIDNAIDQLNEAGTKAAAGVVSGAVKVGTDALAAVPGAGAIVEVGKIVNDASKAVGDVAEAASDATSTISKVVGETSANIDEGLDKLNETKNKINEVTNKVNETTDKIPSFNDVSLDKMTPSTPQESKKVLDNLKQQGGTILNRTNKSLDDFENPLKKTGGKTKRRLFKRKAKSKRVRFAI